MTKETKVLIEAKNEYKSTSYYCDNCKKLIAESRPIVNDDGVVREFHDLKEKGSFEIFIGHRGWGNDSCDSAKTIYACCDDCLAALFLNYVEKDHKDYPSAYFEIDSFDYKF